MLREAYVCKVCGDETHFAKKCPSSSAKVYARQQLENETPALHILHDLAESLDSLVECPTKESVSFLEPHYSNDSQPDLATSGAPTLTANIVESHGTSNGEIIDSSAAVHHIALSMNAGRTAVAVPEKDF